MGLAHRWFKIFHQVNLQLHGLCPGQNCEYAHGGFRNSLVAEGYRPGGIDIHQNGIPAGSIRTSIRTFDIFERNATMHHMAVNVLLAVVDYIWIFEFCVMFAAVATIWIVVTCLALLPNFLILSHFLVYFLLLWYGCVARRDLCHFL